MKIEQYKNKTFEYVQIKQGQNLSTIMQQYSIPANAIIRNNANIDFYEGEVVKIIHKSNRCHIVKPMENLSTIAKKYNTSIEQLIKINNLKSSRLFIGQNLIIET